MSARSNQRATGGGPLSFNRTPRHDVAEPAVPKDAPFPRFSGPPPGRHHGIDDELSRFSGGPPRRPPHSVDDELAKFSGPPPSRRHAIDDELARFSGPRPHGIPDELARFSGPRRHGIPDELARFSGPGPHGVPDELARFSGPPPNAVVDELARFSGPPARRPPPMTDDRLAAQQQEIQGLLVDNQRLAATHVALKQELAAAQHELGQAARAVGALHAENEGRLREMHEKSMKLESECRAAEAKKAELMQVRVDIKKLNASRLELTDQVQVLSQDVARAAAELQQAPALKAEIETMKQEVQRVRSAIELEKKGYAENFEQGQLLEKNLIAITREVERLRAEITEKKTQPAVPINSGYDSYPNPHLAYGANQFSAAYGVNRASGPPDQATGYASAAHASWGAAHDFQRAHLHR